METIVLGFQHYILALGTAVMIPSFLVPLMGGSDVSHSLQLQFLLFCFFILFYIIMYDEIVWYCQISLLRRNGETFCFAFTLFFVLTYHMLKWAVWVPQRRKIVDSESEISSWSLVLLCIVLLCRKLILIFQILIRWFRMIKWGWCRRCFLLKELIHFCRHSLEPGYQQW